MNSQHEKLAAFGALTRQQFIEKIIGGCREVVSPDDELFQGRSNLLEHFVSRLQKAELNNMTLIMIVFPPFNKKTEISTPYGLRDAIKIDIGHVVYIENKNPFSFSDLTTREKWSVFNAAEDIGTTVVNFDRLRESQKTTK